ncbi:butyrophilin subfamily 2 member A1-like [Labrus mixtus]|uniref:butyrophilin subfamily 2 member A1-like n=1 Tax=Labrus mixtus TaxID=508554 RepID=UPI0029C00250|nr:butyrophilin subfamily 2 member A1-like [Labrus mixtus]
MCDMEERLSFKRRLGSFSAFLHHSVVILLLRQCCCAGHSQVVAPSLPIVAMVGDDIILPCRLDPPVDTSDMTVEWARLDLDPRFVYVWRDGMELESKKQVSFRRRTSLSINNLRNGDVSLKLSGVKLSDEGNYRCFIPTLAKEATVKLVVGVVSFIAISLERTEKQEVKLGMNLQCESEGWYPEPEVLWLDSEGNLLSAGSTESIRHPDGLYTVSSRVTVERRHNNMFTCRVTQNNINQTRETHIHVPDDMFMVGCRSGPHITIFSAVGLSFIVALFLVVLKCRQNKIKGEKVTDVTERKTESCQELERKAAEDVIKTLTEQKENLETLKEKLIALLEEVEREETENKKKLTSASVVLNVFKNEVKTVRQEHNEGLRRIKTGLRGCQEVEEAQLRTLEDLITSMTAGSERL